MQTAAPEDSSVRYMRPHGSAQREGLRELCKHVETEVLRWGSDHAATLACRRFERVMRQRDVSRHRSGISTRRRRATHGQKRRRRRQRLPHGT
jgi:hypothetical protein